MVRMCHDRIGLSADRIQAVVIIRVMSRLFSRLRMTTKLRDASACPPNRQSPIRTIQVAASLRTSIDCQTRSLTVRFALTPTICDTASKSKHWWTERSNCCVRTDRNLPQHSSKRRQSAHQQSTGRCSLAIRVSASSRSTRAERSRLFPRSLMKQMNSLSDITIWPLRHSWLTITPER